MVWYDAIFRLPLININYWLHFELSKAIHTSLAITGELCLLWIYVREEWQQGTDSVQVARSSNWISWSIYQGLIEDLSAIYDEVQMLHESMSTYL